MGRRADEEDAAAADPETTAAVAAELDAAAPWGAALLDEVRAVLVRYVVLPTPEDADAVALFILATHCQPAWEHATRLVVKSPVKRCGKTRLMEVVGALCHRALQTTNISPAALVRSIDETDPPTILLDEADTVFAKRRGERSEGAEDLRGILNSGHSRGWPYIRWDAQRRRAESCPTFAMAILGGIGDLPDTVEDRAVVVNMRRRAPGEGVAPWRTKRALPPLHALRERLAEWAQFHTPQLEDADPDLPVEDRSADVWESLVAVADAAGGNWPERARRACRALTGAAEPDEATLGERLLSDLRKVFGFDDDEAFPKVERLTTAAILDALGGFDEAPWADWYGRALTARDLARLLRPYGVRSRNLKQPDGSVAKGYLAADLADPWRRYVPVPGDPPLRALPPLPDGESPYAATPEAGSAPVALDDSEAATGGSLVPQQVPGTVAAVAAVVAQRSERVEPDPNADSLDRAARLIADAFPAVDEEAP
ncbi:MAG: DUF3631 domain-containing protein [Acidimicrobiia bacterium]|nr:DUF3631 domain-containing protein [Acidimicrobiia bacterium]